MSINIIIIELCYLSLFSIHFTIVEPVCVIHSLFSVVLHGFQCFETKSSVFKRIKAGFARELPILYWHVNFDVHIKCSI